MADSEGNFVIGIITIVLSCTFFGSQFVPVKFFKSGDGVFVQFMMGVGSMLVGFVTLGVQGFSPPVYPLVIASGVAWALGNSVAVPVMNNLGMALGMLIWNTTACILGWATSRFGLFGLKKAPPKSNILNYVGLVLVIAGGVIYTFVKSVPYQPSTGNLSDRMTSIDAEVTGGRSKAGSTTREQDFAGYFNDELLHEGNTESFLKRRRHLILRGCWIVVALISGLFYSQMCTAVSYIQDYPELFNNAPANGVHYVFSHFLGIFITATAIFIVYGIVKHNQPVYEPKIALPGIAAGVCFACAVLFLFIGNQNLSQTIAMPMITTVPGCVASIWSLFLFREIKDFRNTLTLGIAFANTIIGAVFIALSRIVST